MSTKPPVADKEAIHNFRSASGFVVKPASVSEISLIFQWGGRLEYVEDGKVLAEWVCLADEHSRSQSKLILLSSGRTSRATKHLKSVHNVISDKTASEVSRMRTFKVEIENLNQSQQFTDNPGRLFLLLHTDRIVNNNLPFRLGEYRESELINSLLVSPDICSRLTAKIVTNTIVELYSSTKKEVAHYISENRIGRGRNLTLTADFWTCKTAHMKFLGVRVYFVDEDWELKSVLSGTRQFTPSYNERDGGIQGPFYAWLKAILDDFGLSEGDFFGASSGAGSDVKYMMNTKLGLSLEWCTAHMTHAATKAACGLVSGPKASANPEMAALVSRIKTTINKVKTVEKVGDLFAVLCGMRTDGRSKKLVRYSPHRFLGLTNSIRRILKMWSPLEE